MRISIIGLGALFAAAMVGCGSQVEDLTSTTSTSSTASGGNGGDGGEGGAPCLAECPEPGVGGASSTNVVTATTTGPSECDALEKSYLQAFEEAIACNGCMGADSCYGGPKLHEPCACIVGGRNPMLVAAAEAAYKSWVDAGCGPYACGKACPPREASYGCAPTASGCEGTCQMQ